MPPLCTVAHKRTQLLCTTGAPMPLAICELGCRPPPALVHRPPSRQCVQAEWRRRGARFPACSWLAAPPGAVRSCHLAKSPSGTCRCPGSVQRLRMASHPAARTTAIPSPARAHTPCSPQVHPAHGLNCRGDSARHCTVPHACGVVVRYHNATTGRTRYGRGRTNIDRVSIPRSVAGRYGISDAQHSSAPPWFMSRVE